MQEVKKMRKKAIIPQNECVACGCCEKVCPMGAISIYKGVYAKVDEIKMVPLWIFNFLFYYVFPDVVEYIFGVCRYAGFKTGCDFALDV